MKLTTVLGSALAGVIEQHQTELAALGIKGAIRAVQYADQRIEEAIPTAHNSIDGAINKKVSEWKTQFLQNLGAQAMTEVPRLLTVLAASLRKL